MEFHEVETAEGSRILILTSAREPDVDAFNFIGESRDLVFAERKVQPFDESLDHRDDEGRRRTQAGPWRRIGVCGQRERQWAAAIEIAHNAIIDGLMQRQLPVKREFRNSLAFP